MSEDRDISNREKDAFVRGKTDGEKNAALQQAVVLKILNSPPKLKALLTHFSNNADTHTLALKYDMSVKSLLSLLDHLGIQTSADARRYIERFLEVDQLQADVVRRKQQEAGQERLFKTIQPEQLADTKSLEERQAEATHKNKMGRVRDLLQQQKAQKKLIVPQARVKEFGSAVAHGFNAVKARFGNVSREDVVLEAKRLLPWFDEGLFGS